MGLVWVAMFLKPWSTSPLSDDFLYIIGYHVTPIFDGRAANGHLLMDYRLNYVQSIVFAI